MNPRPEQLPSNYPRNCLSQTAGREPGVTGIAYRELGVITLVGMTDGTSLLYVATQSRRVRHPFSTLIHGGNTAHYQAGTTCHIALAVIRRLPSPQTQAMRTLLLGATPAAASSIGTLACAPTSPTPC